jgi:Transposase
MVAPVESGLAGGSGESAAKTADLARKHGISEATLYNWKATYRGIDVCEANG